MSDHGQGEGEGEGEGRGLEWSGVEASGELVGTILTAFLPSFLIQSPTAIAVAVVGSVSMLQGMPTMD